MSLRLECWVYGDDTDSLFSVDIPRTGTVADLKEGIKAKQPNNLQHVDPNHLKLYAIPSPEDEHIQGTLSLWTFEGKPHLNSRQKVFKLLGSFIIVRPPTSARFSTTVPDMKLNCWLHGDAIHKIFPVQVPAITNLGDLKCVIKAELIDVFSGVHAKDIRLYHVPDCTADNLEETAKEIEFMKPLLGATPLSSIFSEPLVNDHVHVIIGTPSDDKAMPVQVGERSSVDDVIASLAEMFSRTTMNDGPTPSMAAKSYEYAKIQSGSRGILDCRCPARKPVNMVAPPIQLFHPAFAYFSSKAFDPAYAIPDHFVRDVRDLVARFTLIYDGEDIRRNQIRPVLSKVIGRSLTSIRNSDKTSPDFVVQGSRTELPSYLIVDEEKNEFGDGGSDPSVQASFSFLRLFCQPEVTTGSHTQNSEILRKCCCPAFIIAHAGPWLSIMGGIITAHCVVQRLTDFIWVPIHSTHDDGQCHRIARILYALRESIDRLDSWYKDLDVPSFDLSPSFHSRFWPSPDAYLDGDTLVKFVYLKPLERDASCVTYLAKTVEGSPRDVVVKFVTSYGADAHRHMASKGFAPRILYYGEPNVTSHMPSYGDLRMVVMEHVKGSTLQEVLQQKTPIPSRFKSDLERAFKHLHDSGYVFGDLRKPNVMVLPEGTPGSLAQLIDFDWAGEEGKVTYPVLISATIPWASGVEGLAYIEKRHDEVMLRSLIVEIR